MASPYWVMMGMILLLTPAICWIFTLHRKEMRTPLSRIGDMIHNQRYYLHIMGYVVIIIWKGATDKLNEPIKYATGHWTDWVYAIEGEPTLWIQQTFENSTLTGFLNFHYLFIYLFLIYVTTVYYAYSGERDMTDKVTLNYLLIYALAVPYYLFFNVEVTSSWIPGMKALLYHDGLYTAFYVSHDPLDNAVPSLHVAIPFGILLLNWMHCRERGIKLRDWAHWRYHVFISANTVLFIFTILYLGIHWIIDIPLGMIVGAIGALFIHQIQPRLRNDYGKVFEGINLKRWRSHLIVEGIVTILMVLILMSAVNYQADTNDERASFRLGPGDSTFEIVQKLDYYESVEMNITNWHESETLQVILIITENSVEQMEAGEINWQGLSKEWAVIEASPGETIQFQVNQPKVYHIAILHHPGNDDSGIMEIKVDNNYVNSDQSLTGAYLLSIPSLWITGWVIHRLWRMKRNGVHWLTSTPSHAWATNGENE